MDECLCFSFPEVCCVCVYRTEFGNMSRTNSNGSDVLRRFIQQAESYNRCMFAKTKQTTDEIDFCEQQLQNLSFKHVEKETLTVDLVSNQYKYARSTMEFNQIHSCSIISITSPYAFTVQLTKDLQQTEQFLKSMK